MCGKSARTVRREGRLGNKPSLPLSDGYLKAEQVTAEKREIIARLSALAKKRGQSLAQMAIAWTLRDPRVTSALIGARNPEQIRECAAARDNMRFTAEELAAIDAVAPR